MPQNPNPPVRNTYRGARFGPPLPTGTAIAFLIAVLAIVLVASLSYTALENSTQSAHRVSHTLRVMERLQVLLSTLQDAETGQRGFLLTGNEDYLAPYANAKSSLNGELKSIRSLVVGEPEQQRRLDAIEQIAGEKFQELEQTITMRRAGNTTAAITIVRTNRGKDLMERARTLIADIQRDERNTLTMQQEDWLDAAGASSIIVLAGSCLLLVLVAAAAARTSRDYRARQTQAWIRAGQMGLNSRIQGEQRLEALGNRVLTYLGQYLDARIGTVFVCEPDGCLRRIAAFAVSDGTRTTVQPGEGVLGQAAQQDRLLHIQDVPENYLDIGSSVGRGKPTELVLAPASTGGVVHAIVELGFLRRLLAADLELLTRISDSLGTAVRASKDRSRLEELLAETQRQSAELQTQQEELRATNEELEVQASVLTESQSQLEAQQAELEQTNAQLEEQARALEHQKDELSRAQVILVERATELQRTNQYKNEFLANMSHELRTPLNSALILAKILADNKSGNLTPEQTKYAQTISSAGNDLLAIINDILDLSKVEAGKVELTFGLVAVETVVEEIIRAFEPVARQKGLQLIATVDPRVPKQIETDVQRVCQIVKNLVSNALKFTEHGEVALRILAVDAKTIALSVQDTGIGISEHQQGIIFEAFRQADGSIHRKFGGTGLGLTISRDLARLLGGDISVQSVTGKGSVFTFSLPIVPPERPAAATRAAIGAEPSPRESRASLQHLAPANQSAETQQVVEDDRERLAPQSPLILIIEDDTSFAVILRDLVREMEFQCVITHTASAGVSAASLYRPKAILLDMHLPDYSGLGVLDQLKRNPQTRHIPVHVISVADYTQQALAMGALSYALKPVRREQLIEALRRLEATFSQSRRNVLVVEDDAVQRDSIAALLGNGDVQITAVQSANGALEHLRTTTFDCMVLDLNLPDLSGFELLQQMAEAGEVSFPPVIVYTGRSLTADEEQALLRFSRSIIIKDAHSPERLLDEVTLFLHQVEAQLPTDRQVMLQVARDREATLDGRCILIVEDDVRSIYALTSLFEPRGVKIVIARNGREAIDALVRSATKQTSGIDLVLMDIMMPQMDGITATREIRKRPEWRKLPIIALTAKAMKDDEERCLAAGANDYIAKPLDVEKLMSLVRVWMPK